MKIASIKDIAHIAGVSTSAVSKALNGYTDIGEETRENILKIAEDLQYSPNVIARNLASKNSKTIGLIFSDLKDTDSNGNIIFRLFISTIHCAQSKDYEVLVVNTDLKQQKAKHLKNLVAERRLAGVILYGFKLSDPYLSQLKKLRIPIVTIDMFLPDKNVSTVTIDNESAILEMLTYIKSRDKHRKIAFVNGLADSDIANMRWKAYVKARKQLNLGVEELVSCHADFLESKAYQEANILLDKHPDITCFMCASDLMAMGVMQALRDRGKTIPQQVSVTGFDGIQLCEYTMPTLTTIKQDFKSIGKLATRNLIDAIEQRPVSKVVYAPFDLSVGGSV